MMKALRATVTPGRMVCVYRPSASFRNRAPHPSRRRTSSAAPCTISQVSGASQRPAPAATVSR